MKAPFFLLLCFCLKFGTVLSGSFQPVVVEADVGVLYEDLVSSGNSLPPTTQVTTSLYNPLTSSERALLLTADLIVLFRLFSDREVIYQFSNVSQVRKETIV